MTPVEAPETVADTVRELVTAHLVAPQATQESHNTSEERTA